MHLILLIALLCINFQSVTSTPCPFNKPDLTCDCYNKHPSSKIFENVKCQVGQQDTLPKFNNTISEYTVINELFIQFIYPIRYIEAQSFVAFKSIGRLTLASKITCSITWNETALQGVHVSSFSMTDIYHFNSAFKALLSVEKDLESLRLDDAGACHFGPNDLKDFDKLQKIKVSQTEVSTLDDLAFAGLEDTLTDVSLTDAGIEKYPLNALKLLTKLKKLDFSGNEITFNESSAFASFPDLEVLRLSETNLQSAVDAGVFKGLSQKLVALDLQKGQLKNIPSSILAGLPQLSYLCLAGNGITSLRITDFPVNNKLRFVCVKKNPIVAVDVGALRALGSVETLDLQETKLVSIDLALLDCMNALTSLALDGSNALQKIAISSFDQVPRAIKYITVANSTLTTVDPKCSKLLDRRNFKIFDISNNTQLICDQNLQWMARYSLCHPKRMRIEYAQCGNLQGKLLIDYLKEKVPNPCK